MAQLLLKTIEGVFCAKQKAKIMNNKKFALFIQFIGFFGLEPCKLCSLCSLLFALFCIPLSLEAKVGGVCVNCHTMHNSQNGTAVARGDAPWGGSGGSTSARSRLLVASCLGCHSSTGSSATQDFSGGKVPIVFNTSGYPDPALAGGNFYYVSLGGPANDAKGHNIFSDDVNLNAAPGEAMGCLTNNSCHANLDKATTWNLPDPC